ncbi:Yip1 family protein [Lysinibacillus parviboronicapiens]|uniref:Yip1 family protein n=1 Tax=Lysinibacillus parviboronicapiens TaxID=436516 RepID=UPI000D3AFBD2|nr:Yip1 family protein [Lysinibacillus parviboronicapiens]
MENYKDTPQDRQNVNPFLHVWMHPKQTARFMIDVKSTGFAILVLSIGYIGSLLSGLIESNFMPELSPWIIALFCVILAPIVGIIGTAISAFIFWIFGKLFKGTATFSGLFKALSLSAVPFIALIPFYLIWLFTSPESLMDANFIGSIPWIFWPTLLATLVVTIWSVVVTVGVVGEAHQVSNWKAFFTIFIPTIILGIVFFILIMVLVIGIIGVGLM